MLQVVLIEPTGIHHYLGALPTDDSDLASLANRGRVVRLLRGYPGALRPVDIHLLAYLDNSQLGRLWRGQTLLTGSSTMSSRSQRPR